MAFQADAPGCTHRSGCPIFPGMGSRLVGPDHSSLRGRWVVDSVQEKRRRLADARLREALTTSLFLLFLCPLLDLSPGLWASSSNYGHMTIRDLIGLLLEKLRMSLGCTAVSRPSICLTLIPPPPSRHGLPLRVTQLLAPSLPATS